MITESKMLAASLLLFSACSCAVAADQYCTDIESPHGLCDNREQAYAQLTAHLQWLVPQFVEIWGPGYQVCIRPHVPPNKLYVGGVEIDCDYAGVARGRSWPGNDCPSGRTWNEESHACIPPVPAEPAKSNQCRVTPRHGSLSFLRLRALLDSNKASVLKGKLL
jgi:hypothetical protein